MKILIYNFVQPDELGKQGGGVAVYQRNLVKKLVDSGHKVISMSSGDRYSVLKRTPFLRRESGGTAPNAIEKVYVYNSPVFAPAHSAFYSLDQYTKSTALDGVPEELRALFGSIDVFHFQNIEGLTGPFFRQLKRVFPDARMIVSAHNYSLVCPQVNLWFRETSSCVDYKEGFACVNCIGGHGAHPQELNLRRMETILSYLGIQRHSRTSRVIEFTARLPFRLRRLIRRQAARLPTQAALGPVDQINQRTIVSPELARSYRAYRETNIELCRDVFDHVIAVSSRTREVLVANGLSRENISVSYIGTAHHQRFTKAQRKLTFDQRLHIAYLGYMRRDKGFFFFMDCLRLIPDDQAAKMSVTIAAAYGTEWPAEQLKEMAYKFNTINLFNGYTHASLDKILAEVDLGIIPVLWEDNLPQVAIEIVSRGIPILTSNKGGASEIATRPDYTFRSGSKTDFLLKLERIVSKAVPLSDFWGPDLRVFSMDQHLADMMQYYKSDARPADGDTRSYSEASVA